MPLSSLWNRKASWRTASKAARSSEAEDEGASQTGPDRRFISKLAARSRPGSIDELAGSRFAGRLIKARRSGDQQPIDFHKVYIERGLAGIGAFSRVSVLHRVHDTDGEGKFACKVLRLAPDPADSTTPELSTVSQVENEIGILKRLKHPNVLELTDVFVEPDAYRLVTPLHSGGDLLEALRYRGSFTEDDARTIMRSVLGALKHIHSHGIAHRDLKLENLLLAEPHDLSRIVLIDFGLATDMTDNPCGSACGTPMYVAPEVISDVDSRTGLSRYGCGCDVWSAGVVLFMLLSGSPPFSSANVKDLMKEIRTATVRFHDPVWHLISDEARSLIMALLTAAPEDRITVDAALNHRWFDL
mmetsp:Transcript_36214/g.94056  ORF Transcript_36214/g.94056 Transcript_36214/m.94056 type:complete len:358 (+) Transcript_36214:264-1337(+)|eukprot:jgi/Tetstr1/422850/TSEL_013641.t1